MGRKKTSAAVRKEKICDSCFFRHHGTHTCDYILLVGHSRPCMPSDCFCYLPVSLIGDSVEYSFGYAKLIQKYHHIFVNALVKGRKYVFDIAPMMKGGYPLKLSREGLTPFKQKLSRECLLHAVRLTEEELSSLGIRSH